MQCSSQIFECRAFPTAKATSQSQKLTLLPPIPQTLFLLLSHSAPKSVSAETYQTHNHETLGELLGKMVESEPWRNACG
jgi:hypothetical protein